MSNPLTLVYIAEARSMTFVFGEKFASRIERQIDAHKQVVMIYTTSTDFSDNVMRIKMSCS